MAFVDLRTGNIYGCRVGSRTWFHEKGHIEFQNSSSGMSMEFWKQLIFFWAIALVILSIYFSIDAFSSLSFSLLITYLFIYIYEEVWCWNYSFKNYNGKRKV